MTDKEIIVVNGVLIQSSLPSKALLERRFDEIFRNIEVGKKVIWLVKGYFLNRLGNLSRKFYCDILPRYAVRIADGIYLVPMGKIVDLEREIDELRELYRDYERKLRDFFYKGIVPSDVRRDAKFYKGYRDVVADYIKRISKGRVKVELPSISDRVKINFYPLRIDPTLWENYVSDKLKRREKELVKKLEEDLERARREAVQTAQADIKRKLLELNQAIIKALRQLRKKGRIDARMGRKLGRILEGLRGSNLFEDPEVDRLIKAYEGLTEAIERESKKKRPKEEKVTVIEEIGKAAAIEKPKEEGKEEMQDLDDYADVFKEFADAISIKLKDQSDTMISELQEVDEEFVDALRKLTEAIAS